MFGLMYLLAFGGYSLISLGVVRWAIRYARNNGRSAKRWGWGAALVMYLIPFWDWLPTIALHQYYCAAESGFWVYKTQDQWKQENPWILETLVVNKPNIQRVGDDENNTATQNLNQRFFWTTEKQHLAVFFPIYQWKDELVDNKNNEVIARLVNFSSGEDRESLKFWLWYPYCINGQNLTFEMNKFANLFKGAEK